MKKNIIKSILIFTLILLLVSCGNSSSVSEDPFRITEEGMLESASKPWPPGIGEEAIQYDYDPLTKNYYIILDGSGSMAGEKLSQAKEALERFIKLIPEESNIGLTVFDNDGLSERVALSSRKELLLDAIKKVRANGSTPLRSSIDIAYKKIVTQAKKQLGYGEYNLVIITDGEATEGESPSRLVNSILGESPVIIHTIGFKISTRHSLNQPGRIYYKSAYNLNELTQGLEEVLSELEQFDVTVFNE